MAAHSIQKGLAVPINGEPRQKIDDSTTSRCTAVAVMADDYFAMKPKMIVKPGQLVKRGTPIFTDRKTDGVVFTSPAAGTLTEVNRGDRRALVSVVIELNDNEKQGTLSSEDQVLFNSYEAISAKNADELTAEEVKELLIESGCWTSIRQRPFNKVPSPNDPAPMAMFFTCIDTNPLSADMTKILEGNEEKFALGVKVLQKLSEKSYVCVAPKDESLFNSALGTNVGSKISVETFKGKHPAGLVGTHIHILLGASRKRIAWHIQFQDIIAIGHLFSTGSLLVDRIVALSGPVVSNPRLIKTRVGARVSELIDGEVNDGENRAISGSCLAGRACNTPFTDYLGRYARQLTVLAEGREREFVGWLLPGMNKFSSIPIFLSSLLPGKKFSFTTSTNGEEREMVPIGMYERVMPLDILPTFLLRAMEIGDVDHAEKLGALELDEEDLALCSFVCPGKQDHGTHLRKTLETIYKEG